MKQLSGSDNLFLAQEKGNQRTHVGGLAIYDPSTAPGGAVRFKAILEFYTRRLYANKVFRRRLVHVPLALDRPYWVDDPDIDVEYHIRHIALPHPGDWRQLCIQVARIHARPLDLKKPAWEMYVIEGLDNIPGVPPGSFAMYTKFHHSAIDGEAGVAIIGALHSLSPDPDPAPAQPITTIADREPTPLELLARMVGSRVNQVKLAASLVTDIGPLVVGLGRKQLGALLGKGAAAPTDEDAPPADQKRIPVTRFNRPLSPHRVLEATPIALHDCQAIRAAFPGVTINDIFLATAGGALRRYLEAKGELPASSLRAMVPISTRAASKDADAGNMIAMAVVPLFTQVADAAERLLRVNHGASRGKQQAEAVGKEIPAKLAAIVPSYLVDKVLRNFVIPTFNLTVSNVRGPAVPLYMAGAKLVTFMPVNLLLDGMGLSITGFSYNGVLWVCVVADRSAMPDPAFFARCLKDSFAELVAAAGKPRTAARKAPAGKAPVTGKEAMPRKGVAPARKAVTGKRATASGNTVPQRKSARRSAA
jgi:diacylglycerol O-acyltransferase / wax synthase